MIIWTIMPLEQVFDGMDKPPTYEEIEYKNVKLQVERISSAQCRIIRIISTNPWDFLEPKFQPGQIVPFRPFFAN